MTNGQIVFPYDIIDTEEKIVLLKIIKINYILVVDLSKQLGVKIMCFCQYPLTYLPLYCLLCLLC